MVYPGTPELDFTGTGCPDYPRNEISYYRRWSWTEAKLDIAERIKQLDVDSFQTGIEELERMLTETPDLNQLQADAILTFLNLAQDADRSADFKSWISRLAEGSERLAVPADYLTCAGVTDENDLIYFGAGGLSWSTPFIAGVMALGRPGARWKYHR